MTDLSELDTAAASPVRESELRVTDDLDLLLVTLPPAIREAVEREHGRSSLLEIILDLGRRPAARFHDREVELSDHDVSPDEIATVTRSLGDFGDDNRAGIARTLHRISCLRNRRGEIVGLTLRVGRAVYGTTRVIEDLVFSGDSLLLLGRPGIGKTTMLREAARILSERGKRVVIVDTSNEIAGDGDIPHPAIGRARRMQVATPERQHAVMVEAVENHMPEVIVIDEIGTELEALAARTIAERGVQLVATAHGNALANLMLNPTLSDLIGGIQTVTLGDDEARRRGTQKSVLERKAPPTFDSLVEIQTFNRVSIHHDVAGTVDALLRGQIVHPVLREMDDEGIVHTIESPAATADPFDRSAKRLPALSADRSGTPFLDAPGGGSGERTAWPTPAPPFPQAATMPHRRLFPFSMSRSRLQQAIQETGTNASVVDGLEEADAVMTVRSVFRRRPAPIREAEERGLPIYVLKHNTVGQMEQSLRALAQGQSHFDPVRVALAEAEDAIGELSAGEAKSVELTAQNAYIRRLQHEMAQRYELFSASTGREPHRRVRLSRG